VRVQRTLSALLAALLLCSSPALPAASVLNAVSVTPVPNGGLMVTLSFTGLVPFGWRVNGLGTREITVALPATTAAPNLRPPSLGSGPLAAVHVTSAGTELDVTLDLAASTAVFTSTSGNAIAVVLGAIPRKAARTRAKPRSAVPVSRAVQRKNTPYQVIPLKYADVSEVVGVLVQGEQIAPNDVFSPSGSIFTLPTSTGTGSQAYPSITASQIQPQSLGERINDDIAIDRRLNAVILSGSPEQVSAIKSLIKEIDVPLPSVMLNCQVVELSETAARDLGIDFTSGPGGPIVSGQATAATGGPPTLRADFQASLFATIAHGGGKVLATPRILAVNGVPAQILTGDALPIISTVIYPGTPTITQQTVNYVAVGVNLQIQPRIASDDFVTSHVYAEVSSVTAFVSTPQGSVPQISLRQTSTVATVRDGQPFVIGGLLLDEEIQNLSKIPGLGDLPLLGGIFRVRHDTTTKTNLFIIITPHIIHQLGVSTISSP
jgi:general secretion pathway protein D